jgi:hypothetical protein
MRHSRWLKAVPALLLLQSCYVANHFGKKKGGATAENETLAGVVLGQPLGNRAGTVDLGALTSVYSLTTDFAPAAIRPDPDVYVRSLLRQYRSEGTTMARTIGSVENYRLMLGGATEDFAKTPQESYDATSLLATYTVATQVCRALVAPSSWEHPGWSTILPAAAADVDTNIRFLLQRFKGAPSAATTQTEVDALKVIYQEERAAMDQNALAFNPLSAYVPVCAALAMHAEALFL